MVGLVGKGSVRFCFGKTWSISERYFLICIFLTLTLLTEFHACRARHGTGRRIVSVSFLPGCFPNFQVMDRNTHLNVLLISDNLTY